MIKKTDPAIIQSYLEDSSNLTGGQADGVYLPENEKEIAEALVECNAKKIPLTVSGGETGTTGGCIPFGGWLLTTQKLNKIVEVNKAGKFAIVQPGVTLEEIDAAAKKEGLLYPPDPTEKKATIGGTASTNASGGRGYRFGATRNYVRRIRVVLPSGISLNLKRGLMQANSKGEFILPHFTFHIPHYTMPSTKNSAGYFSSPEMDLVDLFIGHEGTLGIISEIEIGLIPALSETFDIVAFFPAEERAVDFVAKAKARKDPTINFFEYFDENTLQMLKEAYPNIPAGAKAAVYIEQEITPENEKSHLDDWGKLLEEHKASPDNCWLGLDDAKKQGLFKFRHAIPEHINELFKRYGSIKLATDIAVPEGKFKEMFDFYNSSLVPRPSSLFFIKFGHIGENHLHVNLIPKSDKEKALAQELILKFVRKAVSLGGTVSAEHGIGKIKHPYLKEMYGEEGISEMIRIKNNFDPNFILGRGNIFPAVD